MGERRVLRTIIFLTVVICFAPQAAAGADDPFLRLKRRLIRDGNDTAFVRSLFSGPQIQFVPRVVNFNIRHEESPSAYESLLREENIQIAKSFRDAHQAELDEAEARYGVAGEVICAILLIETKCGRDTSTERVFNVFASVAVSAEDTHVRANYKRLRATDTGVTLKQVRKRAKSRGEWAYRELKLMLGLFAEDTAALRELRGSWAGAFGLPQFLPSSYKHFSVSTRGGRADLYNPRDAIHSVANYLKKNGWKETDSAQRKSVWRYNHSPLYVDMVFKVAEKLKS